MPPVERCQGGKVAKGLQHVALVPRKILGWLFRTFKAEVEVSQGMVWSKSEPPFSPVMLVRFRLALGIEFQPQIPAAIALHIIRDDAACNFQMVLKQVKRTVEK